MKLRDRARRLFKRDELSEHTVKASKVDHAVFRDAVRRSPKLAESVSNTPEIKTDEQHADHVDPQVWNRLAEDLWSEFYGQDEPELVARDKIDSRFRLNREIADKQARDESFADTRAMTRGETLESTLGLMSALASFRKSYGNELAEHAERQNEIAQAQDDLDDLDDMLESLRACIREPDNPGDLEGNIERARALGKQKRATLDALREAEAAQAARAGSMIDAVREAVVKARDAAEEGIEAASLLPGSGGGAGRHISADQMIEFAERVRFSLTLKRVLEMMGRLELSMGSKRATLRQGGYEEIVDIETGNDLRSVLPAERALLTHPIGRLDFVRRFHERSLMQYETWSEQELKRGPVIFVADGSGSMRGAANIFCRGLTLASCSIGHREGRNTAAIEFGSKGQMREFFFAKDRPFDTAVALDFAEHFFGGGTDINQCLLRAHDLIAAEEPFHSADLVIVTDGGDRLTESTYALRDKLREAGVKIHGICIGIRPTPYMVEVCDRVSSVFDFAGPNSTTDRIAIDLS